MEHAKNGMRSLEELGNAEKDGLTPLQTLDPDALEDIDDMLSAMSRTAFGGRNLGEALDVLEAMVTDEDCMVVATLSGAMTVAKMTGVLCKMIDAGWVDVVISTGALMAHGFVESIGLKHYKYEFGRMDDKALFSKGYNRVYDTLEPESNFTQAEEVLSRVLDELEGEPFMCSESLCQAIGKHLDAHYEGVGVLKSAYRQGVPVYIPAFTDSELALDVATHMMRANAQLMTEGVEPSQLPFQFNPFLDLYSYTQRCLKAKKMGIFTIGGGVPRNWAQQVGPFVEIASQRVPKMDLPARRFTYGVRVCPEPVHWGGLSGCTYSEGVSWGKFAPPEQGGRYAEVHSDATIAWPLLVKGLDQRLRKRKG